MFKFQTVECEALRKCQPINGGWTLWSKWTGCSESCGKGEIIRTRTCTNPRPQFDGKDCFGEPIQNRPCYLKKCRTDLDVENEILTKDSSKNETEVFIKQTSTYGIVSKNTSKIEKIENKNDTYYNEVSII